MNLHVFGLPEIVKIGFRFQRRRWLETTSLFNYEILSSPPPSFRYWIGFQHRLQPESRQKNKSWAWSRIKSGMTYAGVTPHL
ncbi:MAG: hypothetical protein ACOCPP_02705 [Desulfovermiculus sp.]